MTHDYHDALPGYSPEQILHDGCGECEARSQRADHGVANLDTASFKRAWARAVAWNQRGLPDIASAEMPMLQALWAVQVQLERLGMPIGVLPLKLTLVLPGGDE